MQEVLIDRRELVLEHIVEMAQDDRIALHA
jgi:hypothetical protein